ncbi:hypothetical protein QYF36_001919 [Acer negundo]|nr:hypothetical protein QYF36_001919 [Acer negundo]
MYSPQALPCCTYPDNHHTALSPPTQHYYTKCTDASLRLATPPEAEDGRARDKPNHHHIDRVSATTLKSANRTTKTILCSIPTSLVSRRRYRRSSRQRKSLFDNITFTDINIRFGQGEDQVS